MKYERISSPVELYNYIRNINKSEQIILSSDIASDSYNITAIEEILMGDYNIINKEISFAKEWLENNGYPVEMYYVPKNNHTFLIYKEDDVYNLFELNFGDRDDIRTFTTFTDAMIYYKCLEAMHSGIFCSEIEVLDCKHLSKNKQYIKAYK